MKKGFTLLELLIVIIIISILSIIALSQYKNLVTRARMSEAKATIGAIRLAQRIYFHEHQRFAVEGETQKSLDVLREYIDLKEGPTYPTPVCDYEQNNRWYVSEMGGTVPQPGPPLPPRDEFFFICMRYCSDIESQYPHKVCLQEYGDGRQIRWIERPGKANMTW